MKSLSATYRVFSITMAFLLFFTTTGFSIDMHYCNGQLKSTNFFGKAKSCHEIGQGMNNCPHHKKMMELKKQTQNNLQKKGCCNNKTVRFQLDQDQQNQANNSVILSKQLEYFVVAFVETYLKDTQKDLDKPKHFQYKPPLIPKDIYVLLETFRL